LPPIRGWVYKAFMIPAPPGAPPLPPGPLDATPALRPEVPWSVRLGQVLLIGEGAIWLVVVGWAMGTGIASLQSVSPQAGAFAGVALVLVGVWDLFCVLLITVSVAMGATAVLGVTAVIALRNLTRWSRRTGIVLACAGLPVAVIALGVIVLVANAGIIYCLALARDARAGFERARPAPSPPWPTAYGPSYQPGWQAGYWPGPATPPPPP
jgi:hypothetical protein